MKRLALLVVACSSDKPFVIPDASSPFVDAAPCVETLDTGSGPQRAFLGAEQMFTHAGTLSLCASDYPARWVVAADLTIQGVDRDMTILDGALAGTTMIVTAGHTVKLQDLQLANGIATGQVGGLAAGGNLSCSDSTVTMARVTIQNGQAALGAGVFAGNCTLAISDAQMINNNATTAGGAIAVQTGGTTTLTRVTASQNVASNGSGAAFAVFPDGRIDISQSVIATNSSFAGSADPGGGFYLEGSASCTASAIMMNTGDGVRLQGSAAAFTSTSCDYGGNTPDDVTASGTTQRFDFGTNATFSCTQAGCQ